MPKNQVVREFVRKFDEVQYEIDAHHWLLAVVLFILGLQLMTAWSLTDLRNGLLSAAAAQQKIYRDVSSLQQEVTSLRDDLAALRKGATENAVPQAQKGDAVSAPASGAPDGELPTTSRQSGEQPKSKHRR